MKNNTQLDCCVHSFAHEKRGRVTKALCSTSPCARCVLIDFLFPRYTFVKLNQMEQMEPNTILDVVAVVKGYDDCVSITTRSGTGC